MWEYCLLGDGPGFPAHQPSPLLVQLHGQLPEKTGAFGPSWSPSGEPVRGMSTTGSSLDSAHKAPRARPPSSRPAVSSSEPHLLTELLAAPPVMAVNHLPSLIL